MKTLFMILTVSIAMSYGWGMRGSLIGSERGAVLPGAILGMFLALFSGSELIADKFYFFAAAGAASMAYGGTQTYGQTLGFIVHRGQPDYDPAKGYAGVAVKGGLWQGISGAVIGIMFSAAGGKYYSPVSIIVFFAMIPLMQSVGELIFNYPYKPEEKKFPKIYFSIDRREEWGGNAITLLCLLIFTLVHKDYYSFFFSLVGILGGAAGFSFGMVLYDFVHHPMKNGRFFFGKYNDWVSGWKIMEFTFGAVAGLFFAIYFVATKDTMLKERIDLIEANGGIWNPLGKWADILPWIAAVLIVLVKPVELLGKKITSHVVDIIQRPFIFVVPMILALTGSSLGAQLGAFSLIVYYGAEKTIFDRIDKFKMPWKAVVIVSFTLMTIASVVCQMFFELPPIAYILMYTVYYIVANGITTKHYGKTHITVTGYFVLQTIYLTAVILAI